MASIAFVVRSLFNLASACIPNIWFIILIPFFVFVVIIKWIRAL